MRFLRSNRKVHLSDEEIIEAYRHEVNPDLLAILFERYSHLVFAVSMNYLKNEEESKDAVLAIFEKLASDLQHYHIRKFSAWLHTVTRNYCLKEEKNKKIKVRLSEEDKIMADEPENDKDDSIDVHLNYLPEALKNLNTEQRTCIHLFFLKEKSYREISELTGYDYNQVKTFIQNGKRNLKIYLEKRSNEKI